MIWIKFLGASVAAAYGAATAFRKKTPLFYKIVFFALASFWLGIFYQLLGERLLPAAVEGFHVGYFGYVGMFFFLLSSYYGAINSLVDGGEAVFRKYRAAAAVLPALVLLLNLRALPGQSWTEAIPTVLILLPASGTAYYAGKHLIMPDVEMGIVRVMRKYNAVILALCLLQGVSPLLPKSGIMADLAALLEGALLAAALPAARVGVRKWFM